MVLKLAAECRWLWRHRGDLVQITSNHGCALSAWLHLFQFFFQSAPAEWARLDFRLLVEEDGLGRVMPGFEGGPAPSLFCKLLPL